MSVLVASIMAVNNEVGTIQDIPAISEALSEPRNPVSTATLHRPLVRWM